MAPLCQQQHAADLSGAQARAASRACAAAVTAVRHSRTVLPTEPNSIWARSTKRSRAFRASAFRVSSASRVALGLCCLLVLCASGSPAS